MISEKLMEKPWMFWRVWKAFAANNFTLGGGSYEPILYDDLVALIAGEDLVVGKKYLITDFKTTFTLNISGDPYTDASVEGIVVTALTDASLEPIAYSISHPKDILYYDVDGTTYMPGSTKGCIYRRIDTEKNISVPFDFREFKVEYRNINDAEAYDVGATYNRGKIVKESGNYYISKVSSNLGNSLAYTEYWLPAGANLNFFSGEFEFINLDGAISFSGEASSAYPCFRVAGSSNFVIEGQPTQVSETLFFINGTVVDCKFEKIEKCYFNSLLSNTTGGILKYIISQGNTFSGNTLGNIQGLIINGDFTNNNIKDGFNNNFITSATDNTIQSEFTSNIADANFKNNTIGLRCQNNNFAANFGNDNDEGENHGNIIGNDFKNNTTLGSAFANTIGNGCYNNTWGAWFFNNHLGNLFKNNVCGSNFQDNNLPFYFYSNTTGDNFQNWSSQANLNGIDFTLLTLPSTNTSKYILYDTTDGLSWGYWDNGVFTLASF